MQSKYKSSISLLLEQMYPQSPQYLFTLYVSLVACFVAHICLISTVRLMYWNLNLIKAETFPYLWIFYYNPNA